jgi:hypothetical protein
MRSAELTSMSFWVGAAVVQLSVSGWLALLGSGLASLSSKLPRWRRIAVRVAFGAPLVALFIVAVSRELHMRTLGPLIGSFLLVSFSGNVFLLYLAAGSLTSAEKGRHARQSDILATLFGFFLLNLVWPAGAWWLQARAHRLGRRERRTSAAA